MSDYVLAAKALIDNRKQNSLSSNISSRCLHNMANFGPLTAEIFLVGSLGHPSKFQRSLRLAFVTAATSLTEGQPNFARYLVVPWAGTLYTFRGSCPIELCSVQNSLHVQVLRLPKPILIVLLRGTPAAGVSQTLRRGTK